MIFYHYIIFTSIAITIFCVFALFMSGLLRSHSVDASSDRFIQILIQCHLSAIRINSFPIQIRSFFVSVPASGKFRSTPQPPETNDISSPKPDCMDYGPTHNLPLFCLQALLLYYRSNCFIAGLHFIIVSTIIPVTPARTNINPIPEPFCLPTRKVIMFRFEDIFFINGSKT